MKEVEKTFNIVKAADIKFPLIVEEVVLSFEGIAYIKLHWPNGEYALSLLVDEKNGEVLTRELSFDEYEHVRSDGWSCSFSAEEIAACSAAR